MATSQSNDVRHARGDIRTDQRKKNGQMRTKSAPSCKTARSRKGPKEANNQDRQKIRSAVLRARAVMTETGKETFFFLPESDIARARAVRRRATSRDVVLVSRLTRGSTPPPTTRSTDSRQNAKQARQPKRAQAIT
jgi:hypothetical protein